MAQFATVVAIKGNGTVFAVDAQGNSRALKVGDVLQKGETVRTVGDVQVELMMEDGRLLSVAPAQSVRLDEQVTDSDQRPSAQDSAVAAPAAIDAVIQALERGGDLSQELEAAAAGLGGGAGGAADGGNSFVRLLRITEPLEPLAYNYSFAAPEIEPDIQAVPEETQEPTVSVGITIGAQVGQGQGGPGLISGEIIQGGVSGVGVPEGSDGNAHSVTFLISLNQVATTDVTVTYTIVPGTASHPADYFDGATTGTVTIPAGYTGFFVTENIVGDILVEGDETFTIVLSNPIGATLTNDTATVTIVDDDHAPVAVDDANSLTEDQISVSGNVLPNDSDVDGQTLSVVGPSVTVTNAYGTLVLNSATGGYTFTMNEATQAAAQALDDGEAINMVFPDVYRVTDGANLSNLADITITITGTNDVPIITTNSGEPGGANDLVFESGLAIIGSDAGANSEFASGTFTVSDADGLDDIQSVTINGDTVAIGSLVGHSFAGANGTLTVTAYSGGVASYIYELTSTTTDVDGTETDVFTLTTFDGTATSAPAAITIEIIDDVPSVTAGAVADGGITLTTQDAETDGVPTDTDTASASFAAAFLAAAVPV
ncbi:retention module-containing protein, partial [Ramlibacter sp. 2FC]|uniref:retention module-containing protein n=1 Tax=Ramlibacter sp. 2FC TaxID=2502188 RepID=UPI0010F54C21